MKCSSKTGRSIAFIFVLSVAVLMMVGFSTKFAKADPCVLPDFEPGDFGAPLDINNDFFTLTPGTAFCYRSDSEDVERNEVTVTHCDPLEIGGINTIVVRDVVRVLNDEDQWIVAEDTFDFYAQDNDDNVWYLGEATKTCDGGGDTEGTWNAYPEGDCNPLNADHCPTAGADGDGYCPCGGDPGIVMLADPMNGNCYQQEFLEDHAEDIAKVLRLNATVSVPWEAGSCDQECLKTKEWTPLSPGDVEHKFYSKNLLDTDMGNNVLTEELHGGKTVRVELVDVKTGLDDDAPHNGYCPSDFKDALDALCSEGTPTTGCVFP